MTIDWPDRRKPAPTGRGSKARVAVGALIAPLAPAATAGALGLAVDYPWDLSKLVQLMAVIGYGAALGLGWPAHLVLKKNNQASFLTYAGAGLVTGAATFLALEIVSRAMSGWEAIRLEPESSLIMYLVGALCGFLASVTFWFIAVWRPSFKTSGLGPTNR